MSTFSPVFCPCIELYTGLGIVGIAAPPDPPPEVDILILTDCFILLGSFSFFSLN